MKTTLLYVDDDELKIDDFLSFLSNDFDITTQTNPLEALALISQGNVYDAIILDIMMPEMTGLELAKKIEENIHYNQCPIIFRSGYNDPDIAKEALTSSSREFLGLGIPLHEYSLRIKNKIEDNLKIIPLIEKGDLLLNQNQQRLRIKGDDVSISQTEFKILRFLIEKSGEIIPRNDVIKQVWGDDFYVTSNNFNTHVSNLRKKLDPSTYTILTYKGKGICFCKKGMER